MGKRRWITICHEDGSYSHEISVFPGDEAACCEPGQFWIERETNGHTHWVNPVTKRRNLKRSPGAQVSGNRITGLPQGSAVHVKGHRFEADENGEVVLDPELGIAEDVEAVIDAPRCERQRLSLTCDPVAAAKRTGRERALPQDPEKLSRAALPSVEDQLAALLAGGTEAEAMRQRVHSARAIVTQVHKLKGA